jgi:hypothetical protein
MNSQQLPEVGELLDDIRDFLRDQEDADHNGISYVPNEAMRLLMRLNELFPEEGK